MLGRRKEPKLTGLFLEKALFFPTYFYHEGLQNEALHFFYTKNMRDNIFARNMDNLSEYDYYYLGYIFRVNMESWTTRYRVWSLEESSLVSSYGLNISAGHDRECKRYKYAYQRIAPNKLIYMLPYAISESVCV